MISDHYYILSNLGKGDFSTVKLGIHKLTSSEVAIKIIKTSNLSQFGIQRLLREINILKSINHTNVVKLYQLFEDSEHVYLVQEYLKNGELFELLVTYIRRKRRLNEYYARELFCQILSGVSYLHSKGIVHRDLKTENILIDWKMNLKIIDFGFSTFCRPNELLTEYCGSPSYAAPELFSGTPYIGPPVDIWSIGVILYSLVCGCLPFGGDISQIFHLIMTRPIRIPYFLSQEIEDILMRMLTVNPRKRINLDQIGYHPWFLSNMHCPHVDVKSMELSIIGSVAMRIMKLWGYQEDEVLKQINNMSFGHISATYSLLCDKLETNKEFRDRISHFLRENRHNHMFYYNSFTHVEKFMEELIRECLMPPPQNADLRTYTPQIYFRGQSFTNLATNHQTNMIPFYYKRRTSDGGMLNQGFSVSQETNPFVREHGYYHIDDKFVIPWSPYFSCALSSF